MGGATAPVCGHSIILIALVARAEFDRLGRAGGFTGLAAAAAGQRKRLRCLRGSSMSSRACRSWRLLHRTAPTRPRRVCADDFFVGARTCSVTPPAKNHQRRRRRQTMSETGIEKNSTLRPLECHHHGACKSWCSSWMSLRSLRLPGPASTV